MKVYPRHKPWFDADDENFRYEQVKAHPVGGPILDALHKQDAATYHGDSRGIDLIAIEAVEAVERAFFLLLLDEGPDVVMRVTSAYIGQRSAALNAAVVSPSDSTHDDSSKSDA